MEPRLYLEVLKNLEQLFETKENHDVVIQAGEELNKKEIYAHSVILCCQSNYFRGAFSTNWAEKKDGKYIFRKPNISPHIFEIILRYLYCGQIDLSIENGFDILKATDEIGLEVLNEYAKEFLTNNQVEFLQKDPVGFLEIVFQHEISATIKDDCLDAICQNPGILFGTNKILALSVQILESLLEREDLALDEIEVWNNLIEWAHAKHPTIDKDTSKWTKEDLALMENTLSRFIPLISFRNMTSKEYYDKVLPYRDLLSEILKDIKRIESQLIINADKIDSYIINTTHLALFAGWIEKKDEALKRIPYDFSLILRGSRDGFDARSFHKHCDNKDATIVVVKIKGTNQIVGGFNPLNWNGNYYKNTNDSFIFSFENYIDINTGIIGRVIEVECAVGSDDTYGPVFGYISNSSDLMYFGGEWSSSTNSYPNLNIPRKFEIDDYEVFQVIKKSTLRRKFIH